MRGNVEKNNNPVNIRFVAKTSDMRNLYENIISDVMLKYQKWQHWYQQGQIKGRATGAIAPGPPLQGGPTW